MLKNIRWFICKKYSISRLLTIFLIVIIIDVFYILSKSAIAGADIFTLLFQGTSFGCFEIIDILYYIIFNGIPLYIASMTLDSRTTCEFNYIIIRLRKKVTYYRLTQYSFVVILLAYILMHLIVSASYVLVLNQSFEFASFSKELFTVYANGDLSYFTLIFLGIILRIIELICAQKMLFFLYIKLKNLSIVYILTVVGYFMIPFVGKNVYPLGLSSLLRMTTLYENPIVSIFTIALFYAVICIVIDLYISKKGIYNLLEG